MYVRQSSSKTGTSRSTMAERNSRHRCCRPSRRAALPSSSLLLLFVALLAVPLLTSIPSCAAQRAAVGIGARLKKIVPGRRSGSSLHSKLVPDGESMNDGGDRDFSSFSDIPPTAMLLVTMVVGFLVSYVATEMNGGRERSRIVLSKIAGKSSSDYS